MLPEKMFLECIDILLPTEGYRLFVSGGTYGPGEFCQILSGGVHEVQMLRGDKVYLFPHTSNLSNFLHKPILDSAIFSNFQSKIFTQQFPSSFEALFDLWRVAR